MPNELKPCPECGAEMTIGYACGEYFIYPIGRACWFCDGFNEMHSNEKQEIEAWNKKIAKKYTENFSVKLLKLKVNLRILKNNLKKLRVSL